jgi:ABC-type polysaccharide/polyol phosphate export permease
MSTLRLALHFARRDFRNRYLGSFSGGLWALAQPLLQLAVYAFVFVQVFRQRVPGADAPGYVPFLVCAMWPWNALAESLQRGTLAIQEHAGLIGKVAVPRLALVLAPVIASFAVHGVGFVLIAMVLWAGGWGIDPWGLLLALPLLVALMAFAAGLVLMLSTLQVFVRDIASALPQVLMLWMFLSPVMYGRDMAPPRFQPLLDANPFSAFAGVFRFALLHQPLPTAGALAWAAAWLALVLLAGTFVFRRLQPHVEDFL